MPLTAQEAEELATLKKELGPIAPSSSLSPEENAELSQLRKELKFKFDPGPKGSPIEGTPAEQRSIASAADVAAEATGLPSVFRAGGKLLSGELPSVSDAVQIGLTGLGAGIAKTAGASAYNIGKGLLAGSVGAGVGEYVAGPEAREAARGLEEAYPGKAGKVGGFLLSSAPSIVGSLGAGPAIAGAKNLARSGAAPLTKSLPEWAQVEPPQPGPTGVGSLSRAQQGQVLEGLKTSKYVTPEVMAKAERIEKALGVKLRPGQIESIGKKGLLSDSPLMDAEYSMARTDPAMRTYEKQARAFEDLLKTKGEKLAPGVSGKDITNIGGEIQAATVNKIKEAAQAMDDIDDILISSAEANAHNLNPQKHIVEGLENFLKANNATGKGQARISDDAIKLTKDLIKKAKTRVQSLSQAIEFKRNVVGPETEKAFQALGNGAGKASDGYMAQIYHIFPDAIKASGNESPALKAIVDQYAEAAGKWKQISGKPFDSVKNLAGVINKDESLIVKSPEKVVADVIGSQNLNWLPKIQDAANKGLADMNLIRQAAYADFLKRATKGGEKIDLADPKLVERVSGSWKRMNPSTRQLLFGTEDFDDVMETLNVLTATHRYAPNPSGTARAGQVLERGRKLLDVIPGVEKIRNLKEGAGVVMEQGKAKRFFETEAFRPTAAPDLMTGAPRAMDIATQAGSVGAVNYRREEKRKKYRNLYR